MRLKRRVTGSGMSPGFEDYVGTMKWARGVGASVAKLGGWWSCPIRDVEGDRGVCCGSVEGATVIGKGEDGVVSSGVEPSIGSIRSWWVDCAVKGVSFLLLFLGRLGNAEGRLVAIATWSRRF
ncbi:BQ5605_C009g05596 [Microbotryum silenes-dioicae]|uniref:BQ5605_C009g05596 protein n=1 Tax=Microbotryum silenes-dioicae TaxID=796604 RepID=A0A2X0N0J1_9BASI|nr:BQ5605_C009g05596 [Microbotryum silenes-dioicae]